MLDTHDATRKSLIMTALGAFRVGIFVTLKMVKQLSLSDLQVTLQLFLILVAWGSRVCSSSSAMRALLFIYWKIRIFAALCGGGLKFVAEVQF